MARVGSQRHREIKKYYYNHAHLSIFNHRFSNINNMLAQFKEMHRKLTFTAEIGHQPQQQHPHLFRNHQPN